MNNETMPGAATAACPIEDPAVARLEQEFSCRFCAARNTVAVNSGVAALHLSCIAAGIKEGDEVIAPVFSATATNIPLLYRKAKIVFADVDPETLTISPEHVCSLLSEKTRAVLCADYGGCACDYGALARLTRAYSVPLIADASQSLGAMSDDGADYTAFSFVALSHISSLDGGAIAMREPDRGLLLKRLRRLRDEQPMAESAPDEPGYAYQLSHVNAVMGIAALKCQAEALAYRRELFHIYCDRLSRVPGILVAGAKRNANAAWYCTVLAERRTQLLAKLHAAGIHAIPASFRNDSYPVFGGRRDDLPHMNELESRVALLPLHNRLTPADIHHICDRIKCGW